MLFENANSHCWPAQLVVMRRRVGQNKISVGRYSVSGNALFEMFLKQIQLVHTKRWLLEPVPPRQWRGRAKVWVSSKEILRKLPCSTSTGVWPASFMDR